MECPYLISPWQIQGLDYKEILPVIKWLVNKMMATREIRMRINRRQGIMNYKIKFEPHHHEKTDMAIDPFKMK